jgi:hypothetical protein
MEHPPRHWIEHGIRSMFIVFPGVFPPLPRDDLPAEESQTTTAHRCESWEPVGATVATDRDPAPTAPSVGDRGVEGAAVRGRGALNSAVKGRPGRASGEEEQRNPTDAAE